MISWIQNHLIRHGRWIFIALLVVVIIAFVFTIGNMPGLAPRQDAYQAREFFGYDLNSRLEMGLITEQAFLSAEMDGRPIRAQEQVQSAVMNRIALLHLADTLGVPAPTEAGLSAHLRTRRAFLDETGAFSRDRYAAFVNNPNIPEGMIISVLQDDYRLEQVRSALSGPGYVLPGEVSQQVSRNSTRYTLNTATADFTTFAPEIEATEEDLQSYFDQNAPRYEIPERVRAGYVFFATADFVDRVAPPGELELRQHFEANRTQFEEAFRAAAATSETSEGETDEAAVEEPEEEEPVTFEAVRASVEDDLLQARSQRAAHEAAQAFAYQLYRDSIKQDTGAFDTLLESLGLEVRPISPFSARARGWEGLPDAMLQSAFGLSTDRFYSDAYEVDNGFAVLLYEGRIEPEIPPYETVEARVRTDFEAAEKRRLFDAYGRELHADLVEAVDGGAEFGAAAQVLGLESEAFTEFTRSEPPAGLNPSLIEQAENLSEGEISPMVRVGAEGLFVHVAGKEVAETDTGSEAFTEAREFLARFAAFMGERSLTEELILEGIPQETAGQ